MHEFDSMSTTSTSSSLCYLVSAIDKLSTESEELIEIVELPTLGTSYESYELKSEFVLVDSADDKWVFRRRGYRSNSYWIVGPQLETSARQGDSIPSGAIIRLQHMNTRKWLHSHLHASPISGNQEVSCFGGENESDTGDHWRVTIEGSGKTWKQDQRVRLQHVDTSAYLHSHDKKYQRIAGGQ